MGAVCAADTISDDCLGGDDQIALETVQEDINAADDSKGTFTDLQSNITNSENVLNLNKDYKFDNGTDNSTGIRIQKNDYVIEGNGRTIDANCQSRIFIVTGNNITINNLKLINAFSNAGCAIYINEDSSLILNNVTFEKNFASIEGTILVDTNSSLTINDGIFNDNFAAEGTGMVSFPNSFIMTNNVTFIGNHAVTLIGWDDSYSASNFIITPPGDGAWIIKNSWGTNKGDEGYFYISYYDETFAVFPFPSGAYLFNNTVEYNKNYQYDISGGLNFYPSSGYVNMFEAVDDDLIAGVGTYFNQSGVDYSVEVYVNGDLKLVQNGISPFYGFHTIQLDSFIPIKKGEVFAVLVKSNAVPLLEGSRLHYIEGASRYFVNGTTIMPSGNGSVCSIKVYTVCDDTKVINNKDISVDYAGGSYFSVKVVTADGHAVGAGEKVTFTINKNPTTVTTDKDGIAKIKINDGPGKYTLTTKYNGKTYTNKVTVKHVLTATKVTVKKTAKKFTLKATLKINGKAVKGKLVTFKFNGKTYKVKTNSKGVAQKTLKKNVIKKLKKGKTYSVKVTYGKDTIKTTVKVR